MSYIEVHIYDGDAEEYDTNDERSTVGDREQYRRFTDGEELDAAAFVVGLVADGRHFDVRRTVF
ncbi:hypothetical protein NPS70_16315 [Streptomyces sp. C10-9-1]|uniref:hypothetical protein n=1 Tax=Streptomyces sp. C10-9-1 TaxID=1859285 RepID=UPI002111FCA7|nr:hypothetical protein [Streptomyces sp. C10-9-1]MCQ6554750.1 hypothetical protein [Streptomyces sp. C10-9-1]